MAEELQKLSFQGFLGSYEIFSGLTPIAGRIIFAHTSAVLSTVQRGKVSPWEAEAFSSILWCVHGDIGRFLGSLQRGWSTVGYVKRIILCPIASARQTPLLPPSKNLNSRKSWKSRQVKWKKTPVTVRKTGRKSRLANSNSSMESAMVPSLTRSNHPDLIWRSKPKNGI